jgi:hypothetical protein
MTVPGFAALACYAAALALTLTLAAWCTPRAWWRRPNLRALAVLVVGTLGFGAALSAWLAPTAAPTAAPATASAAAAPPAPALAALASTAPPADGASYRVIDHLNLRQTHGVRASRVIVLPAGTRVHTTGAFDGDWWQVRARLDGHDVEGWASSLWLRRVDEGRGGVR